MAAKKNLTGAERRVANYRAKGLSFRAISEKMGHSGDNGTWAFRMCRRIGVK